MNHDANTQRIIEGCQKGEAQWQRALYDTYSARYYALCCRYVDDNELAKDILIEGFVTIYGTIGQYRGSGTLEAWMYRIFVNTAIRHYHRYQRQGQQRLDDETAERLYLNDHADEQFSLKEALQIGMKRLDQEQRILFNMIAVEGYPFDEAATTLDLSLSSAKRRYYKAQQIMRTTLENLGYGN